MRGVGGNGRLKILECEAATNCGGRPGLFHLANDAGRGEPQLNGLTVKVVSGEVLAVEALSATDRAQIFRCASGAAGDRTRHSEAAQRAGAAYSKRRHLRRRAKRSHWVGGCTAEGPGSAHSVAVRDEMARVRNSCGRGFDSGRRSAQR
jgi:hypothetical protein